MKSDVIKIDKYEPVIENGNIVVYAVKGKDKYLMPECYKEMYNDKYLAIRKVHRELPELYETTPDHYIPLRTSD